MPDMKCKTLYREFSVDLTREGAIDEDARTVEVAFSSEEPVERYFGTEILDHSPDAVRLGRLQNGGAVLVDHNRTDHVGVVESVRIDADRRGRAVLRFGKGKRASEVFDDVKDGIRSLVSVGYRIYEIVEKTKESIVRATDWEPYEISLVSIPADATVGVGRDVDDTENDVKVTREDPEPITEDRTMPEEKKTPAEPAVDVKAVTAATRKAELQRVREITALGARHEMVDLADQYIDNERTVEEFRKAALDEIDKRAAALEEKKPTKRTTVTVEEGEDQRSIEEMLPHSLIGLTPRETGQYSLMRAIRAAASNDWKEAGFERECSLAIADNLNREAQGFFVPWEVQAHVPNLNLGSTRAAPMSVGTAAEGGYLKGTDHLAGSFIEHLYNASVVMQAGATTLTGLVGDVDIPAQTGSKAFEWLAEGGTTTAGVVPTGTVTLAPTTVAGAVSMTRRLLKQSAPSVEAMVLADLVKGAALAIDNAAIEGSGVAPIPEGVLNTTGINTAAIADAGGVPTWAELVSLETACATDNALMGSLGYITTSAIVGGMKTTAKDAGSGLFLMDSVSGTANGYPVYATNHLTAGTIVFGNWADLLIGMWGVLDIMPDRATLASSAGLVLWAFQDCDVAVRHAVSFCNGT